LKIQIPPAGLLPAKILINLLGFEMTLGNRCTEVGDSSSPLLVILIHGTWAYGFLNSVVSHFHPNDDFPPNIEEASLWSDCGNNVQKILSAELPDGTRIRSFRWSGYNSVRARRYAANKLAAEIRTEHDRGARRIFLVAHSHAGNIAQYASAETENLLSGVLLWQPHLYQFLDG